jgi:hypothetical protein
MARPDVVKSTLAEKFAIIRSIAEFIVSGDVYVSGSCGLMLALLMERALPTPVMFALMAYVLAPGDLDIVFASEDPETLVRFLNTMGANFIWGEPIVYAYMKGDRWIHVTEEDLPKRVEVKLSKYKCLNGRVGGLGMLRATMRVTDDLVWLSRMKIGKVEVDVRFAKQTRPAIDEMYDAFKLDKSTIPGDKDPMAVAMSWRLKGIFADYYMGSLPEVPIRSPTDALDAVDPDCEGVDIDDALKAFVDDESFALTMIKPLLAKCFDDGPAVAVVNAL